MTRARKARAVTRAVERERQPTKSKETNEQEESKEIDDHEDKEENVNEEEQNTNDDYYSPVDEVTFANRDEREQGK